MIGYLITVSGLGGLISLDVLLTWYSDHAYWFLGSALLFLLIAAYFNLYRYPTKINKILMTVNVIVVVGLIGFFWI